MRRGDIVLVDLSPSVGAEADKLGAAVVVSNDGANSTASRLGRGVVTVVPVTSNIRQVYPFQVLLPADRTGLRADAKAQAEQARSVDVAWVGRMVGRLSTELVSDVRAAQPTLNRPLALCALSVREMRRRMSRLRSLRRRCKASLI